MILVPKLSLEECIEFNPLDYNYGLPHYIGTEIDHNYQYFYWGRYWKGYTHTLCHYALLAWEVIKQNPVDYYNCPWSRYIDKTPYSPLFFRDKTHCINTGLPEWWGNNKIHDSHAAYLQSGTNELGDPRDDSLIHHIKCNIPQRMKDLQSIIRASS